MSNTERMALNVAAQFERPEAWPHRCGVMCDAVRVCKDTLRRMPEMKLLMKVAQTGSDVLFGLRNAEFRDQNGGIEKLNDLHFEAIRAWEQHCSEDALA